jgi:hypothetical protein
VTGSGGRFFDPDQFLDLEDPPDSAGLTHADIGI